MSVIIKELMLTARQYGEVLLPDTSTGLNPGTLATKLSRLWPWPTGGSIMGCKEGMAHFLPSLNLRSFSEGGQVQILLSITRFKPWPSETSVRVSRYKFDRNQKFIPSYKVGGEYLRIVAVQTISKAVIYHGAGFKLCADASVRVQEP